MRVGIDARPLAEPITGIGRYVSELTSRLLTKPGNINLYSARPIINHEWSRGNLSIYSAQCKSRLTSMLWAQSELPYRAAKDRVDVFFGTTHRLPHFLPRSIARVVTIHDLTWKFAGETMRPLSWLVERCLMPDAIYMADRIIAVSHSTAKSIEEEYPSVRGRVRVVYPGIAKFPTPDSFQSLSALGIDRPYFLFVGTLEPRKNLERLLAAFEHIDKKIRENFLLVIAGGEGWGNLDILDVICRLNLKQNVVLTGYVSNINLATLYANALFLVMPSLYEGFGLPLVEAMSMGVPVLTSNCASMSEVAGDAGILVDPLSEDSISAGILSLLSNKSLRQKLSERAITNSRRFDWDSAALATWNILEEAIAERVR